jgi:hypothetical protein
MDASIEVEHVPRMRFERRNPFQRIDLPQCPAGLRAHSYMWVGGRIRHFREEGAMATALTLEQFLARNAVDYDLLPHATTHSSLRTAVSHVPAEKIAKAVVLKKALHRPACLETATATRAAAARVAAFGRKAERLADAGQELAVAGTEV